MKVNMSLLSEMDNDLKDKNMPAMETGAEDADIEDGDEEDEGDEEDVGEDEDESDRHSKLKTFLFIAAMAGGFVLAVYNMTSLVNNMRLDNQGFARASYVYDISADSFQNGSEGTAAEPAGMQRESEVSTDAARDGPDTAPADEAEDAGSLEKKAQDALNEAALVKQELKNAEDMLDSSLQREAELQSQLDALQR